MGPNPFESDVPGMHIWGWFSEAEQLWLMSQAAQMDSVCEVGSLHGRSSFGLLTACPGPVYCVDPWDDEKDQCYGSFMRSCGHFPNLRAVRGYSPAAIEHVPEVDMSFIDGNHDYNQVTADIDALLPKTRRLICGHDFQNEDGGFPDVAVVVKEKFDGRFFVPDNTAIWAVEL